MASSSATPPFRLLLLPFHRLARCRIGGSCGGSGVVRHRELKENTASCPAVRREKEEKGAGEESSSPSSFSCTRRFPYRAAIRAPPYLIALSKASEPFRKLPKGCAGVHPAGASLLSPAPSPTFFPAGRQPGEQLPRQKRSSVRGGEGATPVRVRRGEKRRRRRGVAFFPSPLRSPRLSSLGQRRDRRPERKNTRVDEEINTFAARSNLQTFSSSSPASPHIFSLSLRPLLFFFRKVPTFAFFHDKDASLHPRSPSRPRRCRLRVSDPFSRTSRSRRPI